MQVSQVLKMQWIVPQIFKLLPKRHIFFDLVIRFITNRKYTFFCIFYVGLSADNIILIYWIKIDSYKWSWLTVVELSINIDSEQHLRRMDKTTMAKLPCPTQSPRSEDLHLSSLNAIWQLHRAPVTIVTWPDTDCVVGWCVLASNVEWQEPSH